MDQQDEIPLEEPGGSKVKSNSARMNSESQQQQSHRSIGSLVLLTQKFVKLMKARGGQIDLKTATDILDVQKRRIYDITNVLEGVGLIEKTRHSSTVRWRGDFKSKKEVDTLRAAYARKKHLVALEADLDIQLDYARRNLMHTKNDELNKSFAYITRDDLLSLYNDNVVITIPNHDEDMVVQCYNNGLHLMLDNGGLIDIRLVTNQGKSIKHIKRKNNKNKQKTKSTSTIVNERLLTNMDTPSPSSSSSTASSTQQTSAQDTIPTTATTTTPTTTSADLVTSEHTYYCDPELKEQLKEVENEIAARVILRSYNSGHSLRRFFPDNPNIENPALLPINPPYRDYSFAMAADEGICELFDISCP